MCSVGRMRQTSIILFFSGCSTLLSAGMNNAADAHSGPLTDSEAPDVDGIEVPCHLMNWTGLSHADAAPCFASGTPAVVPSGTPAPSRVRMCALLEQMSGLSQHLLRLCTDTDLRSVAHLCQEAHRDAGLLPSDRAHIHYLTATPPEQVTWGLEAPILGHDTSFRAPDATFGGQPAAEVHVCLQALEARLSQVEEVLGLVTTSSSPPIPVLARLRALELRFPAASRP